MTGEKGGLEELVSLAHVRSPKDGAADTGDAGDPSDPPGGLTGHEELYEVPIPHYDYRHFDENTGE